VSARSAVGRAPHAACPRNSPSSRRIAHVGPPCGESATHCGSRGNAPHAAASEADNPSYAEPLRPERDPLWVAQGNAPHAAASEADNPSYAEPLRPERDPLWVAQGVGDHLKPPEFGQPGRWAAGMERRRPGLSRADWRDLGVTGPERVARLRDVAWASVSADARHALWCPALLRARDNSCPGY
jgi:hypothetical protein